MCAPLLAAVPTILSGGAAAGQAAIAASGLSGAAAGLAGKAAAQAAVQSALATVGTAAATGLTIGTTIHGQNQQAKMFEANAKAANQAKIYEDQAVNEDLALKQEVAAEEMINRDMEARKKKSTAFASALESGVRGNSVDALLSELEASALRGNTITARNLEVDRRTAGRQFESNTRTAQSRINSVAKPSKTAAGLQIAGHVADKVTYTKADGFGWKE